MKATAVFPNRNRVGATETILCEDNIVIVGANGSGKTRLGSWLEYHQIANMFVHRISAQRALSIPEFAPIKNLGQAEQNLFFGNEGEQAVHHKVGHRWGGVPEIAQLNDYEKLLSTLFARKRKRDSEYIEETRVEKKYIPIPDSPIEIIEKVWSDIMPHRKIVFDDGKVLTSKDAQPSYHGKNMSDGERVVLYLAGQCLCTPENSIVIVDEPEIHLHKSIMTRLWNTVEELCPNKLIIYITHDLDFASTRIGAKKIWIKEFGGNNDWIWEEIPEIEGLPENLIVEIIGNRKNIIFTEGEKSSFDTALYQSVYPEYHIIPRGGCEKVIEATKALQGVQALHHLSVTGIIDNDYRTKEEIDALQKSKVYTIGVAEVENLFCVDGLLEIVAQNQILDPQVIVPQVHEFVLKSFQDEFDNQVANRVESEVLFKLNSFVKTEKSEKGIIEGLANVNKSIDIPALYAEVSILFRSIIDTEDYISALRYYNSKSLPKRISKFFKLANDDYTSLILRLLKTERKREIVNAIRPFVPEIT